MARDLANDVEPGSRAEHPQQVSASPRPRRCARMTPSGRRAGAGGDWRSRGRTGVDRGLPGTAAPRPSRTTAPTRPLAARRRARSRFAGRCARHDLGPAGPAARALRTDLTGPIFAARWLALDAEAVASPGRAATRTTSPGRCSRSRGGTGRRPRPSWRGRGPGGGPAAINRAYMMAWGPSWSTTTARSGKPVSIMS